MDPSTEFKPMVKLRRESERIKVYLSANSKVPFNMEYFMNDKGNHSNPLVATLLRASCTDSFCCWCVLLFSTDVAGTIERSQFDTMAQATLLPRLIDCVKKAMEKANVKKEELQSIEIVGGAVRIPVVQKALQDFFGREMSKTCDGDESVARGCALMCAMISPVFKVKEFEVEDCTPYAIDMLWGPIQPKGADDSKWVPEDSTPLFPVNNSIPSVKLISFNDRTDPFQIVARYAEPGQLPPGTNPTIGRFIISGIPAKDGDRKGKIKVKVKLSANSVLSVTSAQLQEEVKDETLAAPTAQTPTVTNASPSPAPPGPSPGADAAAGAAAGAAGKTPNPDEMEEERTAPADKMDAESTSKKAAAAAPAGEAKIRVRKTDLKVEAVFTSGLDEAAINQYFENENKMQHQVSRHKWKRKARSTMRCGKWPN
jgi:molecular chaperone DnaK (HSP70)